MMAFYDRIAKQWHTATGFNGGAFKQFVLNGLLIDAIQHVQGRSIIEPGAGSGYFFPLVLRRYSGQSPARLVITDQSMRQFEICQETLPRNDWMKQVRIECVDAWEYAA